MARVLVGCAGILVCAPAVRVFVGRRVKLGERVLVGPVLGSLAQQ